MRSGEFSMREEIGLMQEKESGTVLIEIMRSTAIDKNLISGSSCFYPEFFEFRVISKFYQIIKVGKSCSVSDNALQKPSIHRQIYIRLL